MRRFLPHALASILLLLSALPGLAQVARGTITLEAGQGQVVTLREPAANVFVGDPKVAEVRPAGPTSLFVFGTGPGRTTVAALNAEGRSVGVYELTVRTSAFPAGEANGALRRIPGAAAQFRQTPSGLVLDGSVGSAEDAFRAERAGRAQIPAGQSVQNGLRTRSSIQVTLQVRIAEMSRAVTREFGVNWSALGPIGRYAALGAVTANPLAVATGASRIAGAYANRGTAVDALLDALAQDNLARVLAEPNLTALSGEAASFLVGGEFPIPVSQERDAITVQFKQYGVGLTFVPTVLDGDRINLHLRSEVSALTQNGAVSLSSNNNAIQIPALTVRRAETSVEMGSGQSVAIAGLLQDTVTQTNSAVPWLGEIPILGTLFRSDSFQRNKTELVIIVTPILTRPVSNPSTLVSGADKYQAPGDGERVLLLRQQGGTPMAPVPVPVPVRLPGQAGFVVQ